MLKCYRSFNYALQFVTGFVKKYNTLFAHKIKPFFLSLKLYNFSINERACLKFSIKVVLITFKNSYQNHKLVLCQFIN